MVPLTTLLALHDTSNGVSEKNLYCASYYHFNIRNSVVPFMTQLASCDIAANISGIICCMSFHFFNLRHAMVHLMILLALCDTDTNASGIKLPKGYTAPDVVALT